MQVVQRKTVTSSGDEVVGRAAVITEPGRSEMKQTTFRAPLSGEVRVRLEGCGVCASNIPLWQGRPWFHYPIEPGAPGHEAWGRIDAVGPDVDDVSPGQRVAMLSSHAYAEYDICRSRDLVEIPESLNGVDFPGEALGCAMNIFNRAAITAGDTVAIVGVGFLGALLTQLAVNAGAKVFAISRRQEPLAIAKRFGAAEVIQSQDPERAKKQVMEATFGCGCNCVIEAVGTQATLDLATELTGERGRLVIAGYHQDGPRQVNMQLWNWRGLDVINAHERDPQIYVRGMKEAIGAIASGLFDPLPLYTHHFSLDQLPEAFAAVVDRPGEFMKGLLIL
ncbi:MAG TPA: zinc-binding dehydrogenase [Pyrinomonadaceae bacterium]|nr:zinc-binding dehydrogenase [Pyrinomonadaceae bacterium]